MIVRNKSVGYTAIDKVLLMKILTQTSFDFLATKAAWWKLNFSGVA
jgi:hypothetical protein